MSDPEWNALRWGYRRQVVVFRRTLVTVAIAGFFSVCACLAMFLAQTWVPLLLGITAGALLISRCPGMVRDLQDMEERLAWIENHW